MSCDNPLWVAPRIRGELRMLGLEVAESTVDKYMVRFRRPTSQRKTILRNHAVGIASIDLLGPHDLLQAALWPSDPAPRGQQRRRVTALRTFLPAAQT